MRDPEFALEKRSIQILTDPYKSILVSGILPLASQYESERDGNFLEQKGFNEMQIVQFECPKH